MIHLKQYILAFGASPKFTCLTYNTQLVSFLVHNQTLFFIRKSYQCLQFFYASNLIFFKPHTMTLERKSYLLKNSLLQWFSTKLLQKLRVYTFILNKRLVNLVCQLKKNPLLMLKIFYKDPPIYPYYISYQGFFLY